MWSVQCFCRKEPEKWVATVKDEWLKPVQRTVEASRFHFLDVLQQLPVGNCEFYYVEMVKCSTEPSPIPKHTPVLLGTNRTGVHFLQHKPRKLLHTIDLVNIRDCAVKDRGVCLRAKEKMTKPSYSLTTEAAEEICRTVNRHVQHFVKQMQTSKRQQEPMTLGESETTSNPSSALDWSACCHVSYSEEHETLTSVEELSPSDVTRSLDVGDPSRQRPQDERDGSVNSATTVARSDTSSQPSSGPRSPNQPGDSARGPLGVRTRQVRQAAKKTVNKVSKSTKK